MTASDARRIALAALAGWRESEEALARVVGDTGPREAFAEIERLRMELEKKTTEGT